MTKSQEKAVARIEGIVDKHNASFVGPQVSIEISYLSHNELEIILSSSDINFYAQQGFITAGGKVEWQVENPLERLPRF